MIYYLAQSVSAYPGRRRKALSLNLLLTCLLLFLIDSVQATTVKPVAQNNPNFIVELLAQDLGIPWGMTFLNPDELMFTEREGKLSILDLTTLAIRSVSGLPRVEADGQGGMLDVTTGPEYLQKGWIYFTYAKPGIDGSTTTLARARHKADRLLDWQDLLVSDSATDTDYHFGSRIAFDSDGHVFFGIGDRGIRENAQNLKNHMGSIIRLNLDGSVPESNPFYRDVNARAEIWSYGHRNPQGLFFDLRKQLLWSLEHGPRGGDELNLILKGRNYGWPVISHGKEYWGPVSIGEGTAKAGMEQPVKFYIPSIAPGSLLLYSGRAFPQWRGNLFMGALKLRHLNRIVISDDNQALDEERLLGELGERIRALAQSPEGWIYFSTDSGKILRLRPAL